MKKFLRQFWMDWLGFSLRGHSPIGPSEPLSRFVVVERWVDKKENRAKAAAFLPHRNGTWGTSVYRSAGASMDLLWRIGRQIASGTHDRTLYGRAVFHSRALATVSQTLVLKAGRLPSLHRDVVGWPETKAEQKRVAERLAAIADYEVAPAK